jgi:hypothetical protein
LNSQVLRELLRASGTSGQYRHFISRDRSAGQKGQDHAQRLTEEQERFAKQFHPPASKIDKKRKITVRHVACRGSSTKKQGARQHNVKPGTLKKRELHDVKPDTLKKRASLSVSLASSMRLTMTIRRSLTPTTLSYRCSRSLSNETCSSRVSSLR